MYIYKINLMIFGTGGCGFTRGVSSRLPSVEAKDIRRTLHATVLPIKYCACCKSCHISQPSHDIKRLNDIPWLGGRVADWSVGSIPDVVQIFAWLTKTCSGSRCYGTSVPTRTSIIPTKRLRESYGEVRIGLLFNSSYFFTLLIVGFFIFGSN